MSYIYRAKDAAGNLLYLGLTKDLERRIRQHLLASDWINDADEIEYEEWPELGKLELHNLEAELIRKDAPKMNRTKVAAGRSKHIDWLQLCAARAQKIREMSAEGMTLDAIGQEFGITRQRVHQILSSKDGVSRATKKVGLRDMRSKFRSAQIARAKKILGMS